MTDPTGDETDIPRASDAPVETADTRVEGWIRTMLSDSMLGPLYAVLLGHGVAFFAPILLFAFRDRSLFGLAGVAILIVVSGSVLHRDWERYRRPGPLGGTLLAIWLLSAGTARLAHQYGFL